MKKTIFDLERVAFRPTYTIGKIYDSGQYFCDSLEDPVRVLVDKNKDGDFDDAGEGKIKGETAIPEGIYRVVITMSNRFKKLLPLLLNVPGYAGIRIHAGVIPEHTEGCILPGKNKIVGRLVDSKLWSDALQAKIQNYINNGYEVYLRVTNKKK